MSNIPSTMTDEAAHNVDETTQLNEQYSPDHITLATFQTLLKRYQSTVETVLHQKAAAKPTKKPNPPSKSKSKSKSKTQTATPDTESPITAYLTLDKWRYDTLPATLRNRGPEPYLTHDELVQLMQWKLKHGVFRPALLGMVRSNPEARVREATSRAFALLGVRAQSPDDVNANSEGGDGGFPGAALDALVKPLRGVGPATGSLVLSVAAAAGGKAGGADTPFYSDDVYLWLCLGGFPGGDAGAARFVRPNGELSVKYNVAEYRQLWEAVVRLRKRLGWEVVSCADVEMVAFVVRHLDLEVPAGVSPMDEKGGSRGGKKREAEDEGEDEGEVNGEEDGHREQLGRGKRRR